MADKKISDLPAATAPTGSELLPAVQGGANVKMTATQLVSLAGGSNPGVMANGHRMFVDGDSKGVLAGQYGPNSVLFFQQAANPLSYAYDPATDDMAVGGSLSDTRADAGTDAYGNTVPLGMTHPTRIARAVARVNAGCDVCLIQIGTNDHSLSGQDNGAAPGSTLANVIVYHKALRAAGLKWLVIMAVDTWSAPSTAALARTRLAINRGLRAYAEANPDVLFVDTDPYIIDPASAVGGMLGGTSGSFTGGPGSATRDGTHESTYGAWAKGRALASVLARIFPPATLRTMSNADAYNATGALRGNLYANGLASGTGGSTALLYDGTITNGGNAPAGWYFSGSIAGLTADFGTSDPVNDWLNKLTGRTDLKVKRITLAGTPSADGYITCNPGYGQTVVPVAGAAYEAQFAIVLNALTGCHGIGMGYGTNLEALSYGGVDSANMAVSKLPPLDGPHLIGFPAPYTPTGSPTRITTSLSFYFRSGVPVSGSIDLISADLRQISALPS